MVLSVGGLMKKKMDGGDTDKQPLSFGVNARETTADGGEQSKVKEAQMIAVMRKCQVFQFFSLSPFPLSCAL